MSKINWQAVGDNSREINDVVGYYLGVVFYVALSLVLLAVAATVVALSFEQVMGVIARVGGV